MRITVLSLALLGGLTQGVSAQAAVPPNEPATIQPVYWSGDYCGPRCQEHQWRRHERWEARRQWWHHRHWEERQYGS